MRSGIAHSWTRASASRQRSIFPHERLSLSRVYASTSKGADSQRGVWPFSVKKRPWSFIRYEPPVPPPRLISFSPPTPSPMALLRLLDFADSNSIGDCRHLLARQRRAAAHLVEAMGQRHRQMRIEVALPQQVPQKRLQCFWALVADMHCSAYFG